MIVGVDFGHQISPYSGGAQGFLSETTINREVGKEVINYLKAQGHTVVNCTVDYATNSNTQLAGIASKANAQHLDLFVSIHLNAYSDSSAYGTETYYYSSDSKGKAYAQRVNNKLSTLWRNRGTKTANFYVLRNIKAPAILIELFFCTNQNDCNVYKNNGVKKVAKLIVEGILNTTIKDNTGASTGTSNSFKNGTYNTRQARVIAREGLNVRAGRGTNYKILKTLRYGEIINLCYCIGDWISISVPTSISPDGIGYVHTDYIQLI